MNKSITGKHFELTDTIKAYVDAALEGLKKYNLDIISANVVISADERNGKKGFIVEFVTISISSQPMSSSQPMKEMVRKGSSSSLSSISKTKILLSLLREKKMSMLRSIWVSNVSKNHSVAMQTRSKITRS